MLCDRLVVAAVAVAKRSGIRPAGFLALIEVETNGNPFEPDGAPRFLPERHKLYSELKAHAPHLLAQAVAAGLAIPKWSPKTQYKDLRNGAERKALFARMVAIHAECAHRACSWGLGQIMGFEAEHLRYASAIEMVQAMRTGGVESHLEAMVRFLDYKKIIDALNRGDHCEVGSACHNYADEVAEKYNGSQYAQHNYDGRIEDADKRWTRKLAAMGIDCAPNAPSEPARPTPPEQLLSRAQVEEVQQKLRDLGYLIVGVIDGQWDTSTIGAISAFQAYEGLTVTGHYDDATEAALLLAQPKPVSRERATTTAEDLAEAGSKTIVLAQKQSFIGRVMAWLGFSGGAGGLAEQTGALDHVRDLTEHASTAREVLTSVKSLMPSPGVILVCLTVAGLGIGVTLLARWIIQRRVADHNSGVHAGAGA
jgi:hypothetical protein